jgi:hypothetical protein
MKGQWAMGNGQWESMETALHVARRPAPECYRMLKPTVTLVPIAHCPLPIAPRASL